MTTVIQVPPTLDEQTFEQVLDQLAPVAPDAKVLLDARHARWASPYALTAMLCVAQSRAVRPDFAVPESEDTASYWSRAGFFRHAEALYDLHGHVPRRPSGDSNVLLEIAPIVKSEDVHDVVGRVQQKASQILCTELHLDAKSTVGFAMALSETCQNIVEHAQTGGWVMVQAYNWKKRLGRKVVQIAVCDAGIGFRASLESTPGRVTDDRWDDAAALEESVLRGVSRFRDRGRGQGIAGTKRYLGRWNGKLSIRSGTARISPLAPDWDDDVPLQEKLAPFPGAQVLVTIPEKLGATNAR